MGWMAQRGLSEEDKLSSEEAKQALRRSIRMLKPYRFKALGAATVLVLYTLCTVAGPALLRYAIDEGVAKEDLATVNRTAIVFVVIAVAAVLLSRASYILVARIGENFLRDLRVRVFNHIMGMGMPFFDREPTGKLVARMTSDVDSLQELIQQGLVAFVTNGLLFVALLIALVVMSWQLALVCLIAVPPVVTASVRFRRDSNKAYLVVRDRVGQTLSILQEALSGVRVIQAFGQEESQVGRFSARNTAQLDANLDAVKISARYFPVVEFAGIASTAAVVGIGGWFVHADIVTVGTVAAFVLYLAQLFEPIQQLSQLYNTVQQSGAALSKLFGLIDTKPTIVERVGSVDLPDRGTIDVNDVSFAYGASGPTVLSHVTLSVAPGERIALVGPTGAGKSTLAKLMARLYDPTEGVITFGGTDLRDATFASLRHRIVVVPQEGYLFQGTILDNVRLGHEGASDDEVRRAMERIGVLHHFESLPDGLETEVRERGSRLSAGERQLVSLARVAVADPEVLVLDEATSSLDPGTEADVEAAIAALTEGRTVITIAHRLSTAERADRVAVVDAGGLAELGTHDELVALGGRYAALYASWTGGQGGEGGEPENSELAA